MQDYHSAGLSKPGYITFVIPGIVKYF